MREVDVGESERPPPPPRAPWSIMSLSVPLQTAVGVLLWTGAAVAYIDHRFGKVDVVAAQQEKDREKAVSDKELIAKDFQLRDQRIDELKGQMQLMECKVDGGKACGGR